MRESVALGVNSGIGNPKTPRQASLPEVVMNLSRAAVVAVLATFAVLTHGAALPLDTVILNGRIVDGTGSPWYRADVGIRAGRIVAIGHLTEFQARHRINAAGLIVAPGFIDMLGQSELTILVDPRLPSKIFQAITTEITGEGTSVAPLRGHAMEELRPRLQHLHLAADWSDFSGYFKRLEHQGIGINLASFVGATTVREIVIGGDDRPPTSGELERMRALVRQAMEQGAVGLSSALEYPPAPYA